MNYLNKIYKLGFCALLLKGLFELSSIVKINSIFDGILNLIFLGSMIYILMNKKMTQYGFIVLGIFIFLFGLVYVNARYYYIFSTALLILAMEDIDLKDIIKMSYKTKIIYIIFHVVIYIIIFIISPDSIDYSYRDGVQRHYFFMSHANTFAMMVTWTSIEYLYVNYKKLKIDQIIVFFIITLLVKYFSDSNSSFISSIIIILYFLCEKINTKIFYKITMFLARYGYAICSIFFSLITIFYNKMNGFLLNMYNGINEFFTNRLIYGEYLYDNYGSSFLGRTVEIPEKIHWNDYWFDIFNLDNSYIAFFTCYGYITLIIVSIMFYIISKKTNNIENLLISIYVIYGIMESYTINAVYCFPILFIGKYIFQREKEYKKESIQANVADTQYI